MSFVYELEFPLDEAEEWSPVTWGAMHPRARIEDVSCRAERRRDGSVERYLGVLLIRDAGPQRPTTPRQVVVVQRRTSIVELPEWAGDYIGSFTSHRGEISWAVFAARVAPPETRPAPARHERQGDGNEARERSLQRPSGQDRRVEACSPLPEEVSWLPEE